MSEPLQFTYLPAPTRRFVLEGLTGLGFKPKRARGQNFLFDPQLLEALVRDARVGSGDLVLEVGTGPGTLTRYLRASGARVLTCEIEQSLADFCSASLSFGRVRGEGGVESKPAGDPDLRLLVGDVLATKNRLSPHLLDELALAAESTASGRDSTFHLVANLPYSIATPLLQLLLEVPSPRLRSVAVMVQAEAAQRWLAAPGTPEFGAATVTLQLLGAGEITRSVGRQLFSPPPKVDSVFYRWVRTQAGEIDPRIGKLTRHLFQHRRQMLRRGLRRWGVEETVLRELGLDPTARPEELTPADFVRLASRIPWDVRPLDSA